MYARLAELRTGDISKANGKLDILLFVGVNGKPDTAALDASLTIITDSTCSHYLLRRRGALFQHQIDCGIFDCGQTLPS